MEFATIVWTVGIAAWLAFIIYVFWFARQVWEDRLMRCPETGAVALVGVEYVSPRPGAAPGLTVQRCGLWPGRKDCARGCLARYDEVLPGFTPHPDALRPFERL
ncbi:MAG: hypothetical protein HYY78_14315 [Betaproteobacteria bacterium]|nr:hypothetical protein [Betaproteobacteria bacterium]